MSTLPTLVIASRNAGKLRELRGLLEPHGIAVKNLADFPEMGEVDETGMSFAENAAIKATTVAESLGQWVLGEDSGLMVDALGGRPGIYSARFAGTHGDDAANNRKLIEELDGVPDEKRGAQYLCSIAVASPDGEVQLVEAATCRGRIAREPHGTNGFGYDPYFEIVEYHKTFGELPAVVKQQISHRARAMEQLLPRLVGVLKNSPE